MGKKLFIAIACALACGATGAAAAYWGLQGDKMASETAEERVNEQTVLEFVYKYSDGTDEEEESVPAAYMYGWNRERLAGAYNGWELKSFSSQRAVFEKNVAGESEQHYIIKELDGYLAVYYDGSGRVKELTNVPVASLSEDEKRRYSEGVKIDGERELIRFMESRET